jgi:hypothetical protein
MKKPKRTGRRKADAPARKRKKPFNPVLDVLQNLDAETLALLRQTIQSEMGSGPDPFDLEDPVDAFEEFIDACADPDADEERKSDLLENLVLELRELKIDANGGLREAREKIQAIADLLSDAIERRALDAPDMMVVGKLLADSRRPIPDALKQALAQALESG